MDSKDCTLDTRPIKNQNLIAQAAFIKAGFEQFPTDDLTQEGLVLVGLSGAGKSTILTSLLSIPLCRWTEEDELIYASDKEYQDRCIGHIYPATTEEAWKNIPQINGVGSTTTHITAYHTAYQGKDILLFDTPGFDDTNNNRILANALMLEQIIKQSEKKLAIVIDFNTLDAGQGALFQRLTELLCQLFFTEQLSYYISKGDILFLFTDKSERTLTAKTIRSKILQMTRGLEKRKESVDTVEKLAQLDMQIVIARMMGQVGAQRLMFVNPLDQDDTRSRIFSAVREMRPINNTIFNFDTTEKIVFRDDLRENFILPYLRLMRHERMMGELTHLDDSMYAQLRAYKKLPAGPSRLATITLDTSLEEAKLSQHVEKLTQLKSKYSLVIEQLQHQYRPDEEIEFVTMTGDNRAYTLIEKTSMTGLAAAIGYTGYSGFIAANQATAAAALTTMAGSTTFSVAGVTLTCSSALVAGGVVAGFIVVPALLLLGGSLIARSFSTDYVEKNYPLVARYSGARFTKAAIRYQDIIPDDDHTMVDYYEIDPNSIVISPDYHQCTVNFRKKQGLGPQKSHALCIMGKKEHHPEFEPIITQLKNESAELQAEIDKYEQHIELSHKTIRMLHAFKESTDEETLDNLLTLTKSADYLKKQEASFAQLVLAQQELAAIHIILSYIAVTDVVGHYQKEYKELQQRHRKFQDTHISTKRPRASLVSDASGPMEKRTRLHSLSSDGQEFDTSVRGDAKRAYSDSDLDPAFCDSRMSISKSSRSLSDICGVADSKEEADTIPRADTLFLSRVKEKIGEHVETYLSQKSDKSKREQYSQNVGRSLDRVLAHAQFQHQILNDYYYRIPSHKIPEFREKNEYLLSLMVYDRDKVQDFYRIVKGGEISTVPSEFSAKVANYIYSFWVACIIPESKYGETEDQEALLTAVHNRIQGYFQQYKPRVTGKLASKSDRLARVLSNLKSSVFDASHRRKEITQYYMGIDDAHIPNNESKVTHLLNLIQYNEDKIKALYKLAGEITFTSDSQFASDIVSYIKEYWQPLLVKRESVQAVAVSQHRSAFFAVAASSPYYETTIIQLDTKMTVFKSAFIHMMDKTYRLFAVLLTEQAESTQENALKTASTLIASTNVSAGVNVPFVGSLSVNIATMIAGILQVCVFAKKHLDRNVMQQFYDVFSTNETQRFNEIVKTALRLSVELSPELYYMGDESIIELANIVVKRIIRYINGRQSNLYSQQPSFLDQGQALLGYAISGQYHITPTERKELMTICKFAMRTPIGNRAETSALSKKVGNQTSPTYQAILDHCAWIVSQEGEETVFAVPTDSTGAYCITADMPMIDERCAHKDSKKLPKRIQDILPMCLEIYQAEVKNTNPIIADNIFAFRRQQSMATGSEMSVMS